MPKGQGALEYLMTYGWALIIIVIVGTALYVLGPLNPETYDSPNQQETPALINMTCEELAEILCETMVFDCGIPDIVISNIMIVKGCEYA